MYLFLDTETTGISPNDRIVSICCAFFDSRGHKLNSLYVLIRPDGFEVPLAATAIHGITTERARREGHPILATLVNINSEISVQSPSLLVGHNIEFDRSILSNEYERIGMQDPFSEMVSFCTMKQTTDLCRIPSRYGNFKWPKLDELYSFLFKKARIGEHNAQIDVEDCARCFFELKRLGYISC